MDAVDIVYYTEQQSPLITGIARPHNVVRDFTRQQLHVALL
jgi:hypothetical protein